MEMNSLLHDPVALPPPHSEEKPGADGHFGEESSLEPCHESNPGNNDTR